MLGIMSLPRVHCFNKVVLELPCCTCELVVHIERNQSAIYYIKLVSKNDFIISAPQVSTLYAKIGPIFKSELYSISVVSTIFL